MRAESCFRSSPLNNIDLNSIQWNTVTSELRDSMLARREADAVTSNTVTTVMNVRAVGVPESDLAVFFYARYGVDLYGSSIVTTRAFAEKNPEAVRKFISASRARAQYHGHRSQCRHGFAQNIRPAA